RGFGPGRLRLGPALLAGEAPGPGVGLALILPGIRGLAGVVARPGEDLHLPLAGRQRHGRDLEAAQDLELHRAAWRLLDLVRGEAGAGAQSPSHHTTPPGEEDVARAQPRPRPRPLGRR